MQHVNLSKKRKLLGTNKKLASFKLSEIDFLILNATTIELVAKGKASTQLDAEMKVLKVKSAKELLDSLLQFKNNATDDDSDGSMASPNVKTV